MLNWPCINALFVINPLAIPVIFRNTKKFTGPLSSNAIFAWGNSTLRRWSPSIWSITTRTIRYTASIATKCSTLGLCLISILNALTLKRVLVSSDADSVGSILEVWRRNGIMSGRSTMSGRWLWTAWSVDHGSESMPNWRDTAPMSMILSYLQPKGFWDGSWRIRSGLWKVSEAGPFRLYLFILLCLFKKNVIMYICDC